MFVGGKFLGFLWRLIFVTFRLKFWQLKKHSSLFLRYIVIDGLNFYAGFGIENNDLVFHW